MLLELEDDFRTLIGSAGIVVRTSVRAGGEKLPNLPRTEYITPAAAASWCIETAEKLSKFTIVPTSPSSPTASSRPALVLGPAPSPETQSSRSIRYGDCPTRCNIAPTTSGRCMFQPASRLTIQTISQTMLVSRPDGGWEYVRVKNELARSQLHQFGEAKDIAARSMIIADRLGRACHIMWFVGCVEVDGTPFNLPWYWTEAHVADRNNDRAAYRIFVISDLASLKQFI